MTDYSIGEVSDRTGLSHDTLRYYEKIGLLGRVLRDAGGRRRYADKDISRLAFIQRAQSMNFSLQEIGELLHFREKPLQARPEVLALTQSKHQQVVARIDQLEHLRDELDLLLNLCRESQGESCPILDNLQS